MNDLLDSLDDAITRRAAGEIPAMPELADLLKGLDNLDALRTVPARSAATIAERRQAFMANAHESQKVTELFSLNGRWSLFLARLFPRHWSSLRVALGLMLTFLALGSATAYAAQGSLPTEALYPVKIMTEDLQVALATEPHSEFELLLHWTTRRVEEISALVATGHAVPDETFWRLGHHYDLALRLAAEPPDPATALAQLQAALAGQAQVIATTQQAFPENPALQTAAAMIGEAQALATLGTNDLAALQQTLAQPGGTEKLHAAGHHDPTNTAQPHPTASSEPHHTTSTLPPTHHATEAWHATGTHEAAPTHGPTHLPHATSTSTNAPVHHATDMPHPTLTHPPAATDVPTHPPQPTDTHEPGATSHPTQTETEHVPAPTHTPHPTATETHSPEPHASDTPTDAHHATATSTPHP